MNNWQTSAMSHLSTPLTPMQLSKALESEGYTVMIFNLERWLRDQVQSGELVSMGHPVKYVVPVGGAA